MTFLQNTAEFRITFLSLLLLNLSINQIFWANEKKTVLVSIFADVQDAVLEIQVEASSSDNEEDFSFNCLTCGDKFTEMHLLKKHEQIHLKDACEEVLSIQIPKPQVDALQQMEIATGMTNNALFVKTF